MKLFEALGKFHAENFPGCRLKHLFFEVCIPSFHSNHPVALLVLIAFQFLNYDFQWSKIRNVSYVTDKRSKRSQFPKLWSRTSDVGRRPGQTIREIACKILLKSILDGIKCRLRLPFLSIHDFGLFFVLFQITNFQLQFQHSLHHISTSNHCSARTTSILLNIWR